MKLFFTIFLAVICAAAAVIGFLRLQTKHEVRVQQDTAEIAEQTALAQQAEACANLFQEDSPSTDKLPASVRQQVLALRKTYADLFSELALTAKNALTSRDFTSARTKENDLIDQIKARGIEAHTEAKKTLHYKSEYEGELLENAQNYNDKIINLTAPDMRRR